MRSRRGISKLLWLGAGCSFISVAILVGSIVYQVNIPQFEKDVREARRIRDKEGDDDGPRAERLFKTSLETAEKNGVQGEKLLAHIKDYGEFLVDYRLNYDEGEKVFKHGLDIARRCDNKRWQATFYECLASMQYWAVQSGSFEKFDPTPGLKAVELYPEYFEKPSEFAANTFWALGQTYIGLGEYNKGDEYIEKARKLYSTLKLDLPAGFVRAQIDSLIGRGKYRQANDTFIKAMTESSGDSDSRDRLRQEYYSAIDDSYPAGKDIRRTAKRLLDSNSYKAIEKLATEMNYDKMPLSNANWRFDCLYDGLDGIEEYAPERLWKQRLEKLQSWRAAMPDSDLAQIAYARVMCSYAWKLKRGSNKVDNFDEKKTKKLFNARIDSAWEALHGIPEERRSMAWYSVALDIAWSPEWGRKAYDKIYRACRRDHPGYWPAVLNKASFINASDEKQNNEVENFVNNEAEALTRKEGDKLYALVVCWLDSGTAPNVLSESKFTWSRVRSGLRAVIREHPDTLTPRAALCSLALEADEPATAAEAFDGLN